jgi:hypothetical protein
MARQRKQRIPTQHEICGKIARALQDFGYPDVTTDQIVEILKAWLAGKRGKELPHGVYAIWAVRSFDELEEANPGGLARLA